MVERECPWGVGPMMMHSNAEVTMAAIVPGGYTPQGGREGASTKPRAVTGPMLMQRSTMMMVAISVVLVPT